MRHLVRVSAVWRFHGAFVLSFLAWEELQPIGRARDNSRRAMGTLRVCLLFGGEWNFASKRGSIQPRAVFSGWDDTIKKSFEQQSRILGGSDSNYFRTAECQRSAQLDRLFSLSDAVWLVLGRSTEKRDSPSDTV